MNKDRIIRIVVLVCLILAALCIAAHAVVMLASGLYLLGVVEFAWLVFALIIAMILATERKNKNGNED